MSIILSLKLRMAEQKEPPKPPEAPTMTRRTRFNRTQALGVSLLLILPLVAIAGLLDTSMVRADAEASGLRMEVEYPERIRYELKQPMRVTVHNQTGRSIGRLEVSLSQRYVHGYRQLRFDPAPESLDEEALVFRFDGVEPDGMRRVSATFHAEGPRVNQGFLSATADGQPGPSLQFKTFIFP